MTETLFKPTRWSNAKNPSDHNKMLNGTGYASYALRVKGLEKNSYDLHNKGLWDAGRIFLLDINGNPFYVFSEGIPSENKNGELPISYYSPAITYNASTEYDSTKKISDVIILIHHSNFHFFDGAIGGLIIGEAGSLTKMKTRGQNQQVLMFGVNLIIGIYHLILFLLRKNQYSVLSFSLFCMFISLHQFVSGVAQVSGIGFSTVGYELFWRLEKLSLVLVPISLTYYLKSLLPSKWYNKFAHLILLPAFFLLVNSLLLNIVTLTASLDYYLLFIVVCLCVTIAYLISQVGQKVSGASWVLASFGLIFLGTFNDILHSKDIINTAFIVQFCMIGFILMQASLIAIRARTAFDTAQYLSKELATEVKIQSKKLNRIQILSQQVQNTSDLQQMQTNLKHTLKDEFGIEGFILYTVENKVKELIAHSYETFVKIPYHIIDYIFTNSISLSKMKSIHGRVVDRKKSFYHRRIRPGSGSPYEQKLSNLLSINACFMVPLLMDNEVYAVLTIANHKYNIFDRIPSLTNDDRIDLELLSQYVSSAFYQALQREQIKKAKEEADSAYLIASRAKNDAAINQLAAHLAHEVNNPLNYISTGKSIQSETFEKYHDMISSALAENDEDSVAFKNELSRLRFKFQQGIKQTNQGQERIGKVVAEIRAITGVDGLHFSSFDIVPVINEELVYCLHRNNIKIKEQAIKVTGTDSPILVLSNAHILARSIRTVISNCIHFARTHKGDEGVLYIDCDQKNNMLYIDIGNNSFSIKTVELDDLFDLEKSQPYGTEQIGLAMIKELLLKINSNLVLADHGRDSGRVVFQLQIPLEFEG